MAVRCIALDMDRTTLNAQGKLSKENREALLYAIKKGVHVCIASGRAFSALPEDDIRAFILTHSGELSSMDIIVKDEEKKAEVWALLEESVKDIYITSSIQQLIEISGKNSGKHNGLKFLADLLCISLQETAAFGDADNDVEMLEIAGIGIAVANGSEKALAAADMITSHHDIDGVAEGIYKIL